MAEKPILFSTPMVRAILDGRKTMTRRVVADKFDPANWDWDIQDKGFGPFIEDKYGDPIEVKTLCPYGVPGDILWVRETLKSLEWADGIDGIAYAADDEPIWDMTRPCRWVWKNKTLPSMFMPKGLARIWLTVTDIRVERLQEISEEDAKAEGCGHECGCNRIMCEHCMNTGYDYPPLLDFMELWDSLNAKRGYDWEQNPWVWVISFERIEL